MGVGGKKKGATRRRDIHPLYFIIYILRLIMIIDKEEIRSILAGNYVSFEILVDRVEELVSRSYAEGYSFAKKESDLVEKAAESLSE